MYVFAYRSRLTTLKVCRMVWASCDTSNPIDQTTDIYQSWDRGLTLYFSLWWLRCWWYVLTLWKDAHCALFCIIFDLKNCIIHIFIITTLHKYIFLVQFFQYFTYIFKRKIVSSVINALYHHASSFISCSLLKLYM